MGKNPTALSNELTKDIWVSKWTNNGTFWQEAEGNKAMWKHFPKLLSENFADKQPSELKVFVPLCGKAKDMDRLYKMGFTVVGVEFAQQPITEFFEENSIKFQANPAIASDQSYTVSEDGRIVIGQGDLFNFTPDNLPFPKYDVIWDRGSFEAMNESDRSRYTQLLSSLLAEDGMYFINTPDCDTSEFGGPPLAANKEVIEKYFPAMSVEFVSRATLLDNEYYNSKGLTYMDALQHVMKWKSV